MIHASLIESSRLKREMAEVLIAPITEAIDILIACIEGNHKILCMGNGGSAADAQHMAAELIGRFERERKPFPCMTLTADTTTLTAIGNDYGFHEIFARQIEGLASRDDVIICFSTSGESENVIRGVMKAREKGVKVLGFLGGSESSLAKMVDLPIRVPSTRTCRIQEGHITLVHVICEALEAHFSGRTSG